MTMFQEDLWPFNKLYCQLLIINSASKLISKLLTILNGIHFWRGRHLEDSYNFKLLNGVIQTYCLQLGFIYKKGIVWFL